MSLIIVILFDTYLPPAVLQLNHEAANYFLAKGKEGKRPLETTYQAAPIQPAASTQGAAHSQRLSALSQPASSQPASSQPATSQAATSQAAVESQAAASNL